MSVWPLMLMWLGTWLMKCDSSRRISRVYGISLALPMSNIGRFCLSTIWMRSPSEVMSSSSWSLNVPAPGSCRWLPPAPASARAASSPLAFFHRRGDRLALVLERVVAVSADVGGTAEMRSSTCWHRHRDRPCPVPGCCWCRSTGSRLRKYSEMAARSGLLVEAAAASPGRTPSSRGDEVGVGLLPRTAVRWPPPWIFFTRRTITWAWHRCWPWLAADFRCSSELGEARAQCRRHGLARELQRDLPGCSHAGRPAARS